MICLISVSSRIMSGARSPSRIRAGTTPARLHGIPHTTACRALGVGQAWFTSERRGPAAAAVGRERLKADIRRLFAGHEGRCGSPRITADLKDGAGGSASYTVKTVGVTAGKREETRVVVLVHMKDLGLPSAKSSPYLERELGL